MTVCLCVHFRLQNCDEIVRESQKTIAPAAVTVFQIWHRSCLHITALVFLTRAHTENWIATINYSIARDFQLNSLLWERNQQTGDSCYASIRSIKKTNASLSSFTLHRKKAEPLRILIWGHPCCQLKEHLGFKNKHAWIQTSCMGAGTQVSRQPHRHRRTLLVTCLTLGVMLK